MALPDPAHHAEQPGDQAEKESRLAALASIVLPAEGNGLSLFWHTFFLVAALVTGSVLAWLKTFQALEFELHAVQTVNQIASIVNITRTTLTYASPLDEAQLLKTLEETENLRVQPQQASDVVAPMTQDTLSLRTLQELRHHVEPNTVMSPSVNGHVGIWVSIAANNRLYWARIEPNRVSPDVVSVGFHWIAWLLVATVLSVAGAAVLARLINKPIKQLRLAASRIDEGDYDSSYLDETATTHEIREVNIGFNRMASRLAKIDQDRAVMLAGISHDLRTPLARLRLETELSVSDETTRAHMASDIEQLDRTIDKFLEYARPVPNHFRTVNLNAVIEGCLYALGSPTDIQLTLDMPKGLEVHGDDTELARVFSNLIENARHYGQTPGTGVAKVVILARQRDHWVVVRVRDYGPGVAPDMLPLLTQPFFRGDSARTSAVGAGLGLSIVEKAIQRMGGTVSISCPSSGGLSVVLRLNIAA